MSPPEAAPALRRAVFLDRDGVLIRDAAPVSSIARIELLPGTGPALQRLHAAGYRLVVVTNQAIVARGTVTEAELHVIQAEIERRIQADGGPALDGFYYCPHHPNANLPAYRVDCQCRKPRPGLLLQAASAHRIHLPSSYMLGDRITDIEAGRHAGCRTIWVQTGAHEEARIETPNPVQTDVQPDFVCANLPTATDFILAHPI